MTKIERKIKQRESRAIQAINKSADDLQDVYEGALRVLFDLALLIIGIIIGFYVSETRVQAATTVSVPPRAEYVGPITAGVSEGEEPPTAVNELAIATIPDAEKVERVGEEHVEWESIGVWKLTAYCPLECCNGKGRAWKTSSGKPMKVGWTVASYSLPEGTQIMINGHVYCVEDTGVNHIDILYPDHESASDFGIRKAEVFIKR